MAVLRERWLGLSVPAAFSFMLVCTLGTLATARGAGRLGATLAALLLSIGPAVVYGALVHALVASIAGPLGRASERFGLRRFVERDAAAPREPVVALHAAVIAALAGAALLVGGSKVLMVSLRSIESVELREVLTLVGLAALAPASAAVAVVAYLVARKLVAAFDRRVTLPLPRQPALRVLVWLALPLCAVAVGGVFFLGTVLGPLALPLWLALAAGVQLALGALPNALRLRAPKPPAALKAAATVVLVAASLFLAHVTLANAKSAVALEQARPGDGLLRAARRLSDFDRDGASALFGERDCAAFSATRGPYAQDVPGNGRDEDCDGADAVRGALPAAPTFYGKLREDEVKKYDVVWFVVDAVRADHTSLHGYKVRTTPHLDELARESLVFTQAFSQSSATMLSIPSMQSGLDPGRVQWSKQNRRFGMVQEQRRYLAHMLREEGYSTGFVSAPYIKGMLPGLHDGYDWDGVASRDQLASSRTAAVLSAEFIFKARQKRAPFMLLTYIAAPHGPYYMHGPSYPKTSGKFAKYDAEIMNADRYINFVLDVLRQDEDRWAKTIVIVTSDHGEEFRERGNTNHATTCNVESVHVPLVVRVPGQQPTRVDHPVALLDIVPTLLELVGTKRAATEKLDGTSLLLSAREAERLPQDRPIFCTVVSQKDTQGDFARRSVRAGNFKLMAELRGSKGELLYEVARDPKELKPLPLDVPAHAAVADRLRRWLNAQLTGNIHRLQADAH